MACMYCDKDEKLDSLMIEVCRLKNSIVYLNRDQKHPGRCIVAFDRHIQEYFQMSEQERNGFFADVSLTARAMFELYAPAKLNYATYGDNVPHVHVHIVPKYRDGLNWGAPFDDTLPKKMLSEAEYDKAVRELREKLTALCAEG